MSAKFEKLEGNQGVLTVEVDAEKVNESLDSAFKKVVKQVNVPGFRKGKMPRPLFEKRFGVESLYQDAIDLMLPDAYTAAFEETGIDPVDRPEIDVEQIEKGKSFIFTAKVIVKPEVKLGEYKGLEVEKFDTTVTDEDVDNEIKALQEKQAELVVKEEGKAELGDTVVMDFEGFVDDEAFEGGKADNYSIELGSGQFIPGFEEQLVGLGTGESKDVEVSFPEEYHATELAGKPAVFKVTLHEIKGKELPELDDEFAKDTSEFDTLAQLRADVRAKLEADAKNSAEAEMRNVIVEKVAANTEVEVPEAMVQQQIDNMLMDLNYQLQYQGLNLQQLLEMTGRDIAELREERKADAAKLVKSSLVLEAIADAEKIEATDEDFNAEIEKMSSMYNMEADKLKASLRETDVEDIKGQVKIRKTIDLLVDNAIIA